MVVLSPTVDRLRRATRICGAITIVSFVLAFAGNLVPNTWSEGWLIVPAIALVVWIPSFLCFYFLSRKLGLELRRIEALHAMQPETHTDPAPGDQPPVLYLRSFDEDEATAKLKGSLTEEEHLARLLERIGPVVAIGRPGERLPNVGARRVYVGDDEWQSTIEGLMKRARLVAIRTGLSKGLRWETHKAFELLAPEQLLLVVDSRKELNELFAEARTRPPAGTRFKHPGAVHRRHSGLRHV